MRKFSGLILVVMALLFTGNLTSAAEGEAPPSWKFKGDFRYRHEMQTKADAAATERVTSHVNRFRLRVGALGTVNEYSDVEFRLASGGGRTSTNQTFTGGFQNYSIGIDRASFLLRCSDDRLSLFGGRVKNTYFAAGGSDMVWDSDMNLDGLTLGYKHPAGDFSLFLNTGLYWVTSNTSPILPDNHLLSFQLGVGHKWGDLEFTLGGTLYHYTKFAGQAQISSTQNSTVAVGSTNFYLYDYHLINGGLEVGMPILDYPVALFGDYVTNRAVTEDKNGFLAGVKFGKLKDAGTWQLVYDYRQLKRDAVVGSFADGDFLNGAGTNGKGHRFAAGYQIASGASAAVIGYLGKKGISSGQTATNQNKVQVDLAFAF